ncbi:response regulator [Larkinella sp. C7]|uniref:response regulator n=1 Tax=Larkinella sp. C7 TaxID=2576607 RepID=UPI00111158C8|nr:response regulator [Larkinella sp. C7]
MELPVVLLIEDDEDDLWILEEAFSVLEWPCQLMTFRDGESALTFLKNTAISPSLILLDNRMPGLGGLEVLSLLRQMAGFENTRVIVMSGETPSSFASNIELMGANGYLPKPSSMAQWQQALRQIIQELP